jgi:translocation and assembly module TamB
VRQARASVVYAQGGWTIESLQAQGAGGTPGPAGPRRRAHRRSPGPVLDGPRAWTGINPALADSRLAPAVLAGTGRRRLRRQHLDLHGQRATHRPAAGRIATGRAAPAARQRPGHLGRGWLRLPELQLQTDDASLQGQLEIQPASRSGQGRLQLRLPGAQGRLEGQIAPRTGGGTLALDIADAAQAGAWLRRLPVAGLPRPCRHCADRADLAVEWQGGWQDLQAGLDGSTRVQATLRVPALALHTPGQGAAPVLRVQDARLVLAGTAAALTLTSSGQLLRDTQVFTLQASGPRRAPAAGVTGASASRPCRPSCKTAASRDAGRSPCKRP